MKANELMIGDLVKISHLNKIVKVYRIDRANGKGNGFAAVIDGDYHEGNLEPIPLTPEILEKNGFVNDGVSFWYLDFRIVLSTSKGVSLVCGRQKRFEYVHELQHALRLAGIEKEIILPNEAPERLYRFEYVHELQHALRLAGIEKEIILPNEAPERLYLSKNIYGTYLYQVPDPDDESVVEYTRADAFIEKACEWLRTHSEDDYFELIPDANYCGAGTLNKKRMIEDFRKYMEE